MVLSERRARSVLAAAALCGVFAACRAEDGGSLGNVDADAAGSEASSGVGVDGAAAKGPAPGEDASTAGDAIAALGMDVYLGSNPSEGADATGDGDSRGRADGGEVGNEDAAAVGGEDGPIGDARDGASAAGDQDVCVLLDGGTDAIESAIDSAMADGGADGTGGDAENHGAVDAAGVDSAPDGAAAGATLALLGAERDAACVACAVGGGCGATTVTCEGFGGQVAAAGPSAGQTRQSLCLDTLSCLFTSKCYLDGSNEDACVCGSAQNDTCTMSGPAADATCASIELAGLETASPGTALQTESNTNLGAGRANAFIQCLENANCTSCLF